MLGGGSDEDDAPAAISTELRAETVKAKEELLVALQFTPDACPDDADASRSASASSAGGGRLRPRRLEQPEEEKETKRFVSGFLGPNHEQLNWDGSEYFYAMTVM